MLARLRWLVRLVELRVDDDPQQMPNALLYSYTVSMVRRFVCVLLLLVWPTAQPALPGFGQEC